MKKLFALLALVLGVVSCQTEPEGFDVVVGGEQEVMLNVSLPEATRANSAEGFDLNNLNGYKIRYILEIAYNGHVLRDVQVSESKTATFPVRLAPGRDYQFTVWADLVTATSVDKAEWYNTDLYYNTEDGLSNITFNTNTNTWTPNTEARDAWTDTKSFRFGEDNLEMTLTRPFAKVRVVATDIAEIRKFGIEPTSAEVEYTTSMFTAFNAVDGEVAGSAEAKTISFNYENVDSYENEGSEQLTLLADYIFVPAENIIKFTLDVNGSDGQLIKSNTFNTQIPVERNKVTSIVGNVLTQGDDIKVNISNGFDNKDNLEDAPYYQVAVTGGVDLIKALMQGREIIVLNGITVTAADLAEATRTGAAINPVINLNGFTITVENNEAEALVNLNGGALKVEGAGEIVASGALVETIYNTGEATIDEAAAENVVNVLAEIRAAFANGSEYTLPCDFAISESLTLAADKELVLNLNGKTLTGYDKGTADYGLIVNKGNLTVKNGTITLKAENNRGWNAYSSVISNSCGVLTVEEGAVIEHLGGTDMAYGIDNLSSNASAGVDGSVKATINGGHIKSTYRAIRQFLNSYLYNNELVINGGVIEGANKSIWMQDPNKKSNFGTLTVGADARLKGDVYLLVTAGSTEWPVEVSIADAAFAEGSTVVTGNVPNDYKVVEKDGVWTVALNFNNKFAENTWENIIKACQNNCVPESWNVGDTKAMTIAGKDYQIRILGKNHDTYTAGGTAPLTFQIAEVYGAAPMNATQTNTTGWSGSQMRTKTMAEILEVMPVKDAIKAVNKETLNGTRDGLETTSDKLFLLSEVEVNGSVYFSNNFAEGSRYAFFGDVDSMKLNATYWLRGPGKTNAIGYTQINMSGYMANGSAEYACGVVFGFCF